MSTYYIGSVRGHLVKAYNGNVLVREDELLWIGESDGYPAAQFNKVGAKKFKSIVELKAYALKCDSMPWYCRFKEGTLKIYKCSETIIRNYEEVEVDGDYSI